MTKEHRVPFPSVIGRGPTRVRSKASILTTEGAARARVFSLVPSPQNGEQIGGNATGKETSSISQRFPPFPGRGRGLQVWREENILFEKKLYTKQLSKSRLSTRHPSFPLGVSSFILHLIAISSLASSSSHDGASRAAGKCQCAVRRPPTAMTMATA